MISIFDRLKVLLKSKKIHKLKLTNSFIVLVVCLLKIIFGKLARSKYSIRLEESFKELYGAEGAIIFPHARTALYFVLKSFGLNSGDEVLMTPLTIADMVNSIHTAGLRPKFIDVELKTLSVDIKKLEQSITEKTRVLLITHLFGVVPEMKAIMDIADKNGLIVIEDCSQCFRAQYKGRKIGTFGEAAIFSLTNFKTCSSLFGGMVITDNQELFKKLIHFRKTEILPPKSIIPVKHLIKNLVYSILFSRWLFSYFTYFIVLSLEKISPEMNYRLYSGNIKIVLGKFENSLYSEFPNYYLLDYTDPQAYVGLHSFAQAEQTTRRRTENGELLRQLLKEICAIEIPIKLAGATNVYWRFPIVSDDRDGLKKFLLDHGIDSAPTYLALCSKEPGFEPYHQATPVAERFKKNALVVEVNEKLGEDDIRSIACLVGSYFNREKLAS